MMFCLKIFVLLMLSFTAWSEQTAAPPASKSNPDAQIYTKESSDNVAALNKAAEVLCDPTKALPFPEVGKSVDKVLDKVTEKKELPRDPTQMSGNFRQALKNIPNSGANNTNPNAANNTPSPNIPAIELAAKVMGKNKSVMLRINNHVVQVAEGGQVSLIDSQRVITVRVDSIDKNQVKIFVLPLNQALILQ